jgi:hypothetical protein
VSETPPPPPPKAPLTELYAKGAWAWGPLERTFGEPLDRPVVFILSAMRSGSTLLRIMLAGHPALFVPPELDLLPFISLGHQRQLAETLGYPWIRAGLPSALKELGQLSVSDTLAELVALERDGIPMPAIFERLQRAASPRILVDKSPAYGFHPEWLAYAERVFRQTRYIHLVRHPAPVVESFVRMRFHRLFGRHWLVWDENPWLYGEKFWTSTNRHITGFLEGVAPERQIQVRFEELVREPTAVTGAICHFLGIANNPALLTPYSGNRMLHDAMGQRAAAGDPNILLHSGIDRALADPARKGIPSWPFGAPTREVAARLQYAV